MSSFKDELTDTVNSARKNIKTEAINCFIDKLKTSMRWTAERGETKGAIELIINFGYGGGGYGGGYGGRNKYRRDNRVWNATQSGVPYYAPPDEEYVLLLKLNNLLLIEEESKRTDFEGSKIYESKRTDFERSKIYEWLLKQIHKSGIFDDIHICLNIYTNEMEYFWEVDEE